MMANLWHGEIAYTRWPTVDGRSLKPGAVKYIRKTTTPLVNSRREIIGTMHSVAEFGRNIIGSGETDLPPGRYAVGIDLLINGIEFTPEPSTTRQRLHRIWHWRRPKVDLHMTITDAILKGVTVYTHENPTPAWPTAHIIVSES
jgi:hypothetical protein